MTKSLMPGLVYGTGVFLGTETFSKGVTANMLLIAFGVAVCAYGELNLVVKGVVQQLFALLFEVGRHLDRQPVLHDIGCGTFQLYCVYVQFILHHLAWNPFE